MINDKMIMFAFNILYNNLIILIIKLYKLPSNKIGLLSSLIEKFD